jgi:tRNA A-37 threonylcarbamoyl transferase component Bud32
MATLDTRLEAALHDRYRLEREIGAGGMATVYLAHDLKHDRQVAIKVLHPELAAAIGAERFLAEIRVTANLQHPHILPLHDSGIAVGGPAQTVDSPASLLYYVMPFVKGESLRDRLLRERQLPVAEAVGIARDVARALDYAHRQGVIHRDIKPENILLHEGRPLIADFGIALALSAAGGGRMTLTGMSLGTPHYMSPEQAMGERAIDGRTDVYAVGCVLYEMLTGEPPFTGATAQAIVAKVMSERPVPPSTVRDTVSQAVEDAVLTALAKLPADRFATAGALDAALASAVAAPNATRDLRRSGPAARPPVWRRTPAAVAAAVVVVGVGAVAVASYANPRADAPSPVMRFEVPLPDSLAVQKIVLTPDGTRLLLSTDHGPFGYTFADARLAPLEIPGGRSVQDVDITPDGMTLVFREGRLLKTMPAGGGPVRTLYDSVRTVRVGDDGYVYSGNGVNLRRISIATGASEQLAMRDSVRAAIQAAFGEIGAPLPIPGGRGIAFSLNRYAPSAMWIAVLDLETGVVTHLSQTEMATSVPIGFSPTGHLLFRGPGAVYAIRFDPKSLRADGTAERVLGSLPLQDAACEGWTCSAEAFNTTTLAVLVTPLNTPAVVDRRGQRRSLPNIPPNLSFAGSTVSPDGGMLASQVLDLAAQRQDIWTYRMPNGPLTRVTSAPDAFFWAPRWTADGSMIRFGGVRKDDEALYAIPRDGSRAPETLLSRVGGFGWSIAYHPDGRRLATNACVNIPKPGGGCRSRLAVLTLGSPDSVVVIEDADTQARYGEFSPDGRYLAYLAREVGRHELYVRPLDGTGTRWRVSPTGAGRPRWSRDGRTIFYVANDSMYAAEWSPGSTQPVGGVRTLFRLGTLGTGFDVLPGDSTFVMTTPNDAERSRVVVVANFVRQLSR